VRTRRSVTVPIAAEELWSFVTDWERQADWLADADRVEVVSAVREGMGVRLRVRTRLFGVAVFTEPMEVVGWDPPRGLAIRHGGPVAGTGTWTIEPDPAGSRFTWTEDVVLDVPLVGALAARCYAPILRWMMGRSMRGLGRIAGERR
jgi:carbon monoxide dehydrogenase subunit G